MNHFSVAATQKSLSRTKVHIAGNEKRLHILCSRFGLTVWVRLGQFRAPVLAAYA